TGKPGESPGFFLPGARSPKVASARLVGNVAGGRVPDRRPIFRQRLGDGRRVSIVRARRDREFRPAGPAGLPGPAASSDPISRH
ncbi:MAG: hypothetical protein RIS35_737, partial [Pseudomonadota bacterium]